MDLDRERLQRLQRLALLGRLSSGIIHDFKNMLTGIQGMVQWAAVSIEPESKVQPALQQTLTHIQEASALLNSTLVLFSNKKVQKHHTAHFKNILASTRSLIAHLVPPQIRIETHVEPDLPPVAGDAPLYQDILLNLCLNAIEAMKEKGDRLDIRVCRSTEPPPTPPHADTAAVEAGEWVILSVRDNGRGISAEQQQAVFEAFYTSGKDSGFGLGLWMVREMVTYLQGHLRLSSTPGKGTCFEIFFPVALPGGTGAEVTAPPQASTDGWSLAHAGVEGATILIVEDDLLVMTSLCHWLQSAGYKVISADDGDLALQLFEQHEHELAAVIQDFLIPGRRGELLLTDFHSRRPELPVIVISAFPDTRDFAWIKDSGAHTILPKPFDMNELLQVLQKAIHPPPPGA